MKTNKAPQGPPQNRPDPQLQNLSSEVGQQDWKRTDPLAWAPMPGAPRRRRFLRYQKWILRASAVYGLCWLPIYCTLGATFRWSAASNRIYVENGGSARLSDIKAALPTAPLDLVDVTNKVWLLRADLQIADGCTMQLRGGAVGGDVNELRLQSVNAATNCSCVISITADWGNIDINSTKITSWDTMTGGPDTNPLANGRAYIRVRSSLATNGITALESRMDITNSEICYLGTDNSEAYGLTWKVTGTDPNPTNSIFDKVNVYGNVVKSYIHHNFYGLYTYGAFGMQWLTNEVAYSVGYGMDPHDDSDSLLIQGNNVHHNGDHGIIASMRCDHLILRGNICWSNAENGILLHRSSDYGLLEGNRCYDNGDCGIALTGSSRATIRSNSVARNATAGVRLDLGSADNLVANNDCASNLLYGFYFYKGTAVPEPNDDGRPKRNQFVGNSVHDNLVEGIRLADSDDNTFATNTFLANGVKLRFQRGFRNWLDGNSIPSGVAARTEGDAGSSASTYVRNQSYLEVEAGTNSTTIFADLGGRIYQPEEGAILTYVSMNGSMEALTSDAIGSSSTVVARNFWASANPGTSYVSHVVWAPATRTQWTVAAGLAGQILNFTVGDLAPNTNYNVLKANVAFTNLNTDGLGRLHLTDFAATTDPVVYAVEPVITNLATLQYSAALNRIYIKDGGAATLGNIKAVLPAAPLDLVDPTNKIWLLRADLLIQDGSTLLLHGTNAGGDVGELRLLSLNTGATNSVVSVTADYGNIDIKRTRITSWDTDAGGPDTNYVAFGRAFIRARSSLSTNGVTPLESRMDIANSEICFLGWDSSEAYGLAWKVSGTDPNPTNSIFDKVNVYGDVINSHLHDNFYGGYTYGAFGMSWLTNEIDHNVQYGLNLKEDSDELDIIGNYVHHNGSHGVTAASRCNHLDVQGNLCSANAKSGVLLDQGSNDSSVKGNQCLDNLESGISIANSLRNQIWGNVLLRNQQAGVRLSVGSADNRIESNECASNTLYGIYCLLGTGTPDPGDDGHPKRNLFTGNLVHDNGVDPVRLADSDANTLASNVFTDLIGKLRFQRGISNWLDGNSIAATLSVRAEADANSSAVTFVRNQAYVRVELGTNGSVVFQDAAGRIYQPDEGALPTAITTNGSSLTLTTAGIGSSTSVTARNFLASAVPGTAYIHHLVWTNLSGKQWSAGAGFTGQILNFDVGDLLANTSYVLRRAGVAITNLQSDASGRIAFSETATVTSAVAYALDIPGANNTPPTLPTQASRTIAELTTLTVTNTATDFETPGYLLTYSFLAAPFNAALSASGIITWTPTEAQGPSMNTFVVVVTDSGSPPLSATNTFTVVVSEANSPPVFPAQPNRTIAELTPLQVSNAASDPDFPPNNLTYSFLNAPANASISPAGLITWTPTEAQGPGATLFVTRVTDDGVPPRSATNSFTVVVTEVNSAPVLPVQPSFTNYAGTTLVVTNTATDADLPANLLTYQLTEAPANAAIGANGVITWTSALDQAPGPETFTTVVSDDAVIPLSATNNFVVTVVPQPTVYLRIQSLAANRIVVSWSTPSPGWVLKRSSDLGAPIWTDVVDGALSVVGQDYSMSISNLTQKAYFRLQLSSP